MCMSQPSVPTPSVPDTPTPKSSKDITAATAMAAQAQKDKASKARGYGRSVVTSGTGLMTKSSTTKTKLLGEG